MAGFWDIFDFGTAEKDLEVNVTMMGGRRCGKSSVLAAMQDCFQGTVSRDTHLRFFSEDSATLEVLIEKKAEMDAYFVNRADRSFNPDDTPSDDHMRYSFCIGLRGKKGGGRIRVNFHDYPGEWLKQNPDMVNRLLEKSRIILIAIDTPYMMEESGMYNRLRNNCDDVTNVIMRSDFADSGPGMILFVPLKCEKYRNAANRHDKNLKNVQCRVEEVYKNLIEYVKTSKTCFAAVTPIFTLGDAVFGNFARDDDGDILLKEGIPAQADYLFTDEAGNAPRPELCEQPLYYVLAYVLAMARDAKKAKERQGGLLQGVLNFFQEAVLNWPSAGDYLNEYDAVCGKIRSTLDKTDGYKIINRCDWMKLQ